MLKKLFGSGQKNDGFYLQLDQQETNKSTESSTSANDKAKVAAAPERKPEPAPAPEVKATPAEEKESAPAPEIQPQTTAKKSKQAKSKTQKQPKVTAAKATNFGASSFEPPFWVKAMYNNSGNDTNGINGQKTAQTFATDNLMPVITKARRRPGPSLDKFKDMASKTRAPRG